MIDFTKYRLWIFDCDGVLLDSNRMKTAAFAKVVSGYSKECIEPFLEFQKTAFGLSRFRTFDAFFDRFLGRPPYDGEKEKLLSEFAEYCELQYPQQPVTAGAHELLLSLVARSCIAYVASGSEQSELRQALKKVGLSDHFRDIFGSPRKKSDLVADILQREQDVDPSEVLFIGDAKADFEAASSNGVAFLQVSHYAADPTGMSALREEQAFPHVATLADITLLERTSK
ncbi:HAD hydrolase-like protein [Thioclava sp. 'Guangxiensis']|uniref:HAD family hydrolase n=1 Tax=Thioclava sp. 'Guangxiensis' TaxID=3149044 RepID=UPI003877A729